MATEDWNIDAYRNPWESEEQWEVRKKFMEHYKCKIAEEELVCLAQVYTNIVFLGCRYPENVVNRVNKLAEGVVDDFRKYRKQRQSASINFVKESENMKNFQSDNKREAKLELPPPKHRASEFIKPGNRSNAASYFSNATEESSHFDNAARGSDNKYQMQNYYTSNYKSAQGKLGHSQGSGVYSRREAEFTNMEPNRSGGGPPTYRNVANTADVSGNFNLLESKFNELAELMHKEKLANKACSILEMVHRHVSRQHMIIESPIHCAAVRNSPGFSCDVFIEKVFVAKGDGPNKKIAKKNAYEKAIVNLRNSKITFSIVSNRLEITDSAFETRTSKLTKKSYNEISPEPDLTKANQQNRDSQHITENELKKREECISEIQSPCFEENKHIFVNFIIIRYAEHVGNAIKILYESANQNKMVLKYKDSVESGQNEIIHRCVVEVQSITLGEGLASTAGLAKLAAAEVALDKLRTVAYTLVVKQSVLGDGVVSKDKMDGKSDPVNTVSEDDVIPDSNIGNKLLRMMGWTGGGLGKPGNEGIVEPIKAKQRSQRVGLGCSDSKAASSISASFKNAARQVVLNYSKSDSEYDLVFTNEFSKEDRAFLHKLASKYHLKSVSRAKSDQRYLIISKRRDYKQLVSQLLKRGGSNEKYEVLPPING